MPRTIVVLGGGLVLVVILAIGVSVFGLGGQLSTKATGGVPFTVVQIGPDAEPRLQVGAYNDVLWKTTAQNKERYPGENIALCPPHVSKLNKDCVILHQYVPNNGEANVYVPPYVAAGQWNIVLTAWDSRDRLLLTHAVAVPASVHAPAQVESTISITDAIAHGTVLQENSGLALKNLVASAGEKISELQGKVVDVVLLPRQDADSSAAAPLPAPEEVVASVLEEQVGAPPAPPAAEEKPPVSVQPVEQAPAPQQVLDPQVIITTSSVDAGEPVPFIVSNIELAEIECITATVNGAAATISGEFKMCPGN